MGLTGKIISFTKIHVPPEGFADQAPYVVAIAKLKNNRSCIAQLIDYDEKHLTIGQEIKTVLRKTRDPGDEGVIPYGIKFKPIQ